MDDEKKIREALELWKTELKHQEKDLRDEIKKYELRIEVLNAKAHVLLGAAQRFNQEDSAKFLEEHNLQGIQAEIQVTHQMLENVRQKLRIKSAYNRAIIESINNQ